MRTDPVTRAGHALASAVDAAHRIKQLEAEKADHRSALEACVRAMEKRLTCSPAEWDRALRGAKRLVTRAQEEDERL